jgi:hypothetical protein
MANELPFIPAAVHDGAIISRWSRAKGLCNIQKNGGWHMLELIDPHNAQEIFFDGIHEVRIIEGIGRMVLFSRQNSVGVVVARLALPVSELPDVILALVAAQVAATRAVKPTP